ncbi:hypothetical protein VTL71DRAFT_3839 [Oculimacula yallundae]|uniref:Uncharacterized protein n=1 Tax=Oculimacula yallundae TaxID=86028 RepID=A0ABR4C5C9_9HELO
MNASICRPIARSAAAINKRCIQARATNFIQPGLEISTCLHSRPTHTVKARGFTSSAQRSNKPLKSPAKFSEQHLPPPALLKTAYKSGALHLPPQQVLDFLQDFLYQSSMNNLGWQRRVCLEHNIDPATLGLIAGILEKSDSPAQLNFSAVLLGTAAKFGDRASIFKRVYEANQIRKIHYVPEALAEVGLLAKNGNDPQAMTLLGIVLYTQGKEQQALEWFRKATSGSLDFNGAANALVFQGRILAPYDLEGARAAFARAASELDDPAAFFHLSKLETPGSPAQEAYLTSAAASGVLEACHNLGVNELARIHDGGEQPRSLSDYGPAREWTQIAAEGGFGLSMLNMASMCMGVGLRGEAMAWLEKAIGRPDVKGEAEMLKARWTESEIEE